LARHQWKNGGQCRHQPAPIPKPLKIIASPYANHPPRFPEKEKMSTGRGFSLSRTLLAQEFYDGFGAGTDLKLFVDVMAMFADRLDVDPEHVGNLFVREAFGKQFQDFPFTGGDRLLSAGTRRLIMKILDDFARNQAVQG